MNLSEKYRPKRLDDVVGQPPVKVLKRLAREPYECCVMLEGPPGVGKTSAAVALANDMGCGGNWSGLDVVVSTELTIERCRQLFERELRLRPMEGSGWHCLVIEELEACTSPAVTRYLKVALEKLPRRVVVVATSNGAAGIERALLQRFRCLWFGGGPDFAEAVTERLEWVWREEVAGEGGPEMLGGWMRWGWGRDEVTGEECFSMRVALGQMQMVLEGMEVCV